VIEKKTPNPKGFKKLQTTDDTHNLLANLEIEQAKDVPLCVVVEGFAARVPHTPKLELEANLKIQKSISLV